MNKHAFFVVLLGHFKMVHREKERERERAFLCALSKSLRYDILYSMKTMRRKRKVGKEGSGVSHRARPHVETGGERLKREVVPAGQEETFQSLSLPSSYQLLKSFERASKHREDDRR